MHSFWIQKEIILQVDAEKTYHQKVLDILDKLHAEVCYYDVWLIHMRICSIPRDCHIFLVVKGLPLLVSYLLYAYDWR